MGKINIINTPRINDIFNGRSTFEEDCGCGCGENRPEPQGINTICAPTSITHYGGTKMTIDDNGCPKPNNIYIEIQPGKSSFFVGFEVCLTYDTYENFPLNIQTYKKVGGVWGGVSGEPSQELIICSDINDYDSLKKYIKKDPSKELILDNTTFVKRKEPYCWKYCIEVKCGEEISFYVKQGFTNDGKFTCSANYMKKGCSFNIICPSQYTVKKGETNFPWSNEPYPILSPPCK
ncbi:MAG: hypothetical protein NTX03_11995 [Bacteroidetes bacterium]|nr:hypothetical protein [Bacteroidota bacterium]